MHSSSYKKKMPPPPIPGTEGQSCYSWVEKLSCPELKSKGGPNGNNTGRKEFYGKTKDWQVSLKSFKSLMTYLSLFKPQFNCVIFMRTMMSANVALNTITFRNYWVGNHSRGCFSFPSIMILPVYAGGSQGQGFLTSPKCQNHWSELPLLRSHGDNCLLLSP